jgi:cytochrome P450
MPRRPHGSLTRRRRCTVGRVPGTPDIREAAAGDGRGPFPLGASATIAELTGDPHPLLWRLREDEPVSWLPALGGWLVTRHDLALRVMRDSETFTVDDPRFSTARVVGPSMLSLDGAEHRRHRDPFSQAFRGAAATARLEAFAAAEAARLVAVLQPAGRAELRRGLAGPLAVAVVAELLGLAETDPAVILSWYDAIVSAVTALSAESGRGAVPGAQSADVACRAGREAFGELRASIEAAIGMTLGQGAGRGHGDGHASSLIAAAAGTGGLTADEVVSNAAVLMFGGIETTEGMICNAILHLLSHRGQLNEAIADRDLLAGAVQESLRLEPSAAVIDRYATTDVLVGGARIRRGDLVIVSIAAANRDPAVFAEPDRFDIRRRNGHQNFGFARGSHFCPGAELARLETQSAVRALLGLLPDVRLDAARPSAPRGLVFRKPPSLHVCWTP